MLQPITVSFQSLCASFDSPFGVFTSNVLNGLTIIFLPWRSFLTRKKSHGGQGMKTP
jgi:hypothetical protein